MTFRRASELDAQVIAEIYNESIEAVDSTMIDTPIDQAEIIGHMNAFSAREGYFVLEDDEYVVGWGVIKGFGNRPAYHFTGETSVFLRRTETRKGYGTRLKKRLLEQCRAYGYHHLAARVWASNAASIEYNKQFGYEVVGIQKEIGFMDGQWRDIALLQLVLDVPPPPALGSMHFAQPETETRLTVPQPTGPRSAVILAEDNNDVVGWGCLQLYSDRGGYRFCGELSSMGEQQEKILTQLIEKAPGYNYHHLLARIESQDEEAVHAYLASGFDVVGVQKEIMYNGSAWEDVVVLELVLDP